MQSPIRTRLRRVLDIYLQNDNDFSISKIKPNSNAGKFARYI